MVYDIWYTIYMVYYCCRVKSSGFDINKGRPLDLDNTHSSPKSWRKLTKLKKTYIIRSASHSSFCVHVLLLTLK